jgi:hypothetical protein
MSYIGNQPTTTAFVTDTFSGNGTTTAFTMSVAPATTTSILVSITGVLQDPSTYSINGTTLTFSAAPPTGTGNISVRYLGIPASGVTTTAYRTLTEFTATAGQTTFTPPSYTVGFINVYRNGVLLGTADYTATNGTTVVLAKAASVGDLVTTESFYVSSVLNALPTTGGTLSGNLAVQGSTYVTGDVIAGYGNNAGGGGGLISQGSVTTGTLGANAIFLDNDGTGLGRWRSYGSNTSTYGAFVFQAATSNNTQAERMRIDSSGNVGIGTSSPAMPVHVVKNWVSGKATIGVQTITSFASGGTAGVGFFDSDGTRGGYLNSTSGAMTIDSGVSNIMALYTNNTERMRIDTSGNVLVGQNTDPFPGAGNTITGMGLNASGRVAFSCSGSVTGYFNRNTSDGVLISMRRQGTEVGHIDVTTTATAYVTSSDYRLKENVTPMTGALEKVAQLKPVTYTWKADGSDGQGFIAHELQEVVPDCVSGEKDAVDEEGNPEYQGIDTSFLVATLTAAIQEQQELITSLTARIEALEIK